MWLGTIIRVLTPRGQASEQGAVLFLIHEAAALGKMQLIEDALCQLRGYGIRMWLFFQSMYQVHKCYGDGAATIFDNLDTQQYFGLTSYAAAEEVSKRIGDATIGIATYNESDGTSHPTGSGPQGPTPGSVSRAQYQLSDGPRLIKPEELITMGEDFQVLFHRTAGRSPPSSCALRRPGIPPRRHGPALGFRPRQPCPAALALVASLMASVVILSVLPVLAARSRPTPRSRPFLPRGRNARPARQQPYGSPYTPPPAFGGMGGPSRFPR